MNWFRKPLLFGVLVLLGASSLAAKKDDKTSDPEKSGKVKKDKPEKPGKKPKDAANKPATDPGATPVAAEAPKMSIPLPVGHDAKKLVIPYRDIDGKLQMRFTMEIGKRVDNDHMQMSQLLIETFDEQEKPEMSINMPDSVLDLNSKVISTQTGVTIKRTDFQLTGDSMEFNTDSKQGHVVGKVHMTLYNLDNETDSTPADAPPQN